MSGIWTEDDLRSTIPFEEIDVDDTDVGPTTSDLLSGLPENPSIETERAVARIVGERPTRTKESWEVIPAQGTVRQPDHPARVYDEVTAVREDPRRRENRQWVDVHAVVGDDGELKLPMRLARRLPKGSVVEVRIASWVLPDE